MPFEIDFLANPSVKQDADAICFRFWNPGLNRYTICIFDGGTSDYAESIKKHLKNYYDDPDTIDFIFCSHPDQDHASGLREILELYNVRFIIWRSCWKRARFRT